MKVFDFFSHVFTVFAFLTLGSLLVIFGVHILSMDEAILRIQEVYASSWKSTQTIMTGLLFITIGLSFAKNLVKKGKVEAVILQSELGPVVISTQAIEDVTRKVLKRFHLVKETKVEAVIHQREIKVFLKLVLWSGGRIQDLLTEIQEEVRSRLIKLVGKTTKLVIACDVRHIEDHESDLEHFEESAAPGEAISAH